ncbi:hypothetical protein [Lactobacillus sp.]|uniref:hypothetical protein n=1 Tax=Lactobacillus sp. TaxID=1591 RepID=UPI00199F5DE9|nr:hypothetical protein [Lactobacillus sp.]MBD5430524.1 hypothetical protein [Lactobacillus sp.]MBD5430815.1 hypothetical protein [Lactobacillus sp.]
MDEKEKQQKFKKINKDFAMMTKPLLNIVASEYFPELSYEELDKLLLEDDTVSSIVKLTKSSSSDDINNYMDKKLEK